MKTLLTTALFAASLGLTGCISVIDAGGHSVNTSYDSISQSDERKIKAAVYDYFDGQGDADFERLDRAFAHEAAMFGVRENADGVDTIRVWPDMNKVIKGWGSNPNPAGERDSKIIDISVTDARIATVHFKSADRFYDVLTLVKVNGDWKIVSKVFVNQ